MESKRNKLIMISAVIIIAIILIIISVAIYFYSTNYYYSEKFQELISQNSCETIDTTDKKTKEKISTASKNLKECLEPKIDYIDISEKELNDSFKNADINIDDEKYQKAFQIVRDLTASINEKLSSYTAANEENFNAIDQATGSVTDSSIPYSLVNYRIIGNWASVTILPNDEKIEPVGVLLKNESGLWKVVLGPGSYFSLSQLIKYPDLPDKIKNNPNNITRKIYILNN